MGNKPNNAQVLNAIRSIAPDDYKNRIPLATQNNMASLGLVLTKAEYSAQFNVILKNIVNKIALTIFNSNVIDNPLAFLHRGSLDYGDTIEELSVDIVSAEDYDETGKPDPFKKNFAPSDSLMHVVNSKRVYTITIQFESFRSAFRNRYGLSTFINEVVNKLYDSRNYDRFLLTKNMFNIYRNQQKSTAPLLPGQTVKTPLPVDRTTGEKFYLELKNATSRLQFPSREYSPMKQMTSSPASSLCCFVKSSVLNQLQVSVLAQIFNPNKLDINIPIVIVDDFGDNNDDVICILCDRYAFGIYSYYAGATEQANGKGLYVNHFLHDQELYMASLFKNVIYFVDGSKP